MIEEFMDSRLWKTLHYFIRWVAVACIVGTLGGVTGGVFAKAITAVTGVRETYPMLLYAMPLGGLLIIWLYHIAGEDSNRGTNMVLTSISAQDSVTIATGPLIFISTIITHFVGGSAGREGAALQIGGWIGCQIGRIKVLKMDEREQKMVIMCGMSAVFSALFGTPVAATFFSMEVISVGVIYYAAMLPCLLAAFLGREISMAMGVAPEIFEIHDIPDLTFENVLPMVVLGFLIAGLSIVFIKVLHETEHKMKEWFTNRYIRVLVTSAVFLVLTLLVRTRVYCGGSMILIEKSLKGEVLWGAFLLKMIFTAIALGGGFKGGEIIPTLCVGATFGCMVGTILGFHPPLMAACGMIGLFAAVTNCPISSILLGMEMFQGVGLPFFAVIVALTYCLSGYYSLYGSQKFVYGKLKNIYLNRDSNK